MPNTMPSVPMSTFARFCNAKVMKQQDIVASKRRADADPQLIRRHDFYGRLRHTIVYFHLSTQDLSAFEDAYQKLWERCLTPLKRFHYSRAKDAYTEFWRNRDATPFRMKRATINIGDLTVIVNPELRIHTSYGIDMVTKLRFDVNPPTKYIRQTYSYLMELAKDSAEWAHEWHTGILDIERRTVLASLATNAGVQGAIERHAATYVDMWREAEKQVADQVADEEDGVQNHGPASQ